MFIASLRSTISAYVGLATFTGLSQADGKALELETPMIAAAPAAKFYYDALFDKLTWPKSFELALLFSILSIYPN